MNRSTMLAALIGATLSLSSNGAALAQAADAEGQASLDTVMAFMGAMGKGDMDAMSDLMADDMVWHNEGDTTLPWIGETRGKDNIFDFLGVFSSNLQTTEWKNTDAFASGDIVAVFGKMNGITTASGQEVGEFSFALKARVEDGQVALWHWHEDSFAISQAYHGVAHADREHVQTFYDYLSNAGSDEHAAAFRGVVADGWESLGDYSGNAKTADQFVAQLGGFSKLIPDMDWAVQEMHQDGDTIIVRSRATGTPVGPMFGVDGEGRSFDILTIDIHHLTDGKITKTYHVEDWAGGLQQLAGR